MYSTLIKGMDTLQQGPRNEHYWAFVTLVFEICYLFIEQGNKIRRDLKIAIFGF